MELAHSTVQQNYIKQVKALEEKIKKATEGELDFEALDDAQKRLDALAEKYQYNEKIGTAIYKLYELQAVIHYFDGNDAEALDFINQAIETRGNSYARAEKLKAQLEKGGTTIGARNEQVPPLELQRIVKDNRSSTIAMSAITGFAALISIYQENTFGIIAYCSFMAFYIILAFKLKPDEKPNRGLVKTAAIVTLLICSAILPIIYDVQLWRLNKKLKQYEELGVKAFTPDKQWLADEPKRRKAFSLFRVLLVILVIILLFSVVLALYAMKS